MMNMSTADLQTHNHQFDNNPSGPSMMSTMIKTEQEDYFHDSKSETSSRGGNGKTKVFQCTGYGDCSMVFTRSEHLARHMRKHTGEKPFKCVVPGCERMFSRFDNMMQHTQTHNKARNGPRRTKVKTKRGGKKSSGIPRRANSSDEYDEYGSLPSPPPSRRGSSNNIVREHQIILPNPKYVDAEEDDYLTDEDDLLHPYQAPPKQKNYYPQQQRGSYQASSNVYQKSMPPESGLSRYPDSPASSDSSVNLNDYFPTPSRRRSAPHVRYQPYPYHYSDNQLRKHREIMPSLPRRDSALSQLATYLVDHPDQSPESYLESRHRSTSPETQRMPTRRLSIQDLSNPIEQLDESGNSDSSSGTQIQHEEGVDLTEDEYQAIQGFGQFYRTATTCNK